MTAPFSGYYEQSYPPSVLRRPTPPPVGATAREDDGGELEVGRDELTSPELVATDDDADGEALPDAPAQDDDEATPLPVAAARPRKRREQDRRHDDDGGTEG